MSTFASLVRGARQASHFPPTIAVTLAAVVLAAVAGRGLGTLWVGLAVLAGQFSVGWSNDWFDAERDRLGGRNEKPIVAGLISRKAVRNGALAALALCVPLSFLSGWRAALVHLIAVAGAWAYNGGLKSTWWSPLPYALAFSLLPVFVTLGLAHHPLPPWGIVLGAGAIGIGAHFINTVGDQAIDKANRVDGFPQRLGPQWSLKLGVGFLGGAALALGFGSNAHRVVVGVFVALALGVDGLVVFFSLRSRGAWAWRATLLAGLLCLAIFIVGGHHLVDAHAALAKSEVVGLHARADV